MSVGQISQTPTKPQLSRVFHYFTRMGGNSSKQSSEVERNRRLREFEEELVDPSGHSHTLQPQYFNQFLEEDSELNLNNRIGHSNRNNNEDSESVDDLFFETGAKPENEENGQTAPINDKEVEDAIAELEETFRTLTPDGEKLNQVQTGDDDSGRSKSCGPLNPYPNVTPTPGGSRMGTPMGAYSQSTTVAVATHSKNHPRLHHRRRQGGAGVSRSSGGLLPTLDTGGGTELSKSAPPWGGGSSVEQQWTPPQIQGFDVDKFREVNQRVGTSEKRLPTTKASDTMSSRSDGRDQDMQLEEKKKPYTRDELELLKKLERDVY